MHKIDDIYEGFRQFYKNKVVEFKSDTMRYNVTIHS